MKKLLILAFCLLFSATVSVAQNSRTTKNMSEAQLLGVTAGSALACNAGAKLDDFELIANRYISNQSLDDAAEHKGYEEYARAKLNTFNEQKKSPQITCSEVLSSFNSLPIFKTVVYADGSIKTPEGKTIKARKSSQKVTAAKTKTATTATTTKKQTKKSGKKELPQLPKI